MRSSVGGWNVAISLNHGDAAERYAAERVDGLAPEAAAKLQQSSIIAIQEVGERSGRHFFSMESVEGPYRQELSGRSP